MSKPTNSTYKMYKLIEHGRGEEIAKHELPIFTEMENADIGEQVWKSLKMYIFLRNGIVNYISPPLEGTMKIKNCHLLSCFCCHQSFTFLFLKDRIFRCWSVGFLVGPAKGLMMMIYLPVDLGMRFGLMF